MNLREFREWMATDGWRVGCELRGYGGVPCGSSYHAGHILNKSLLRSKPEAKRYVERYAHLFFAVECDVHNVERYADEPLARALLMQKRYDRYGGELEAALLALASLFKSRAPELRLEVLLAPLERMR